jgi:myo-inositol-1-phosphate synthase
LSWSSHERKFGKQILEEAQIPNKNVTANKCKFNKNNAPVRECKNRDKQSKVQTENLGERMRRRRLKTEIEPRKLL